MEENGGEGGEEVRVAWCDKESDKGGDRRMAEITIPGFICEIKDKDKAELEGLSFVDNLRTGFACLHVGVH